MKIRFTVETITKNGGHETSSTDFEGAEILVGRSGDCQIRLKGHTVSLKHARFFYTDSAFVVEDMASGSGVRVNGRRVSRHPLRNGDEISIGDVTLKVAVQGDTLTVTQIIDESKAVSRDDIVKAKIKGLSLTSYLPSMAVLSLWAFVVVLLVALVPLLSGRSWWVWNSGPISNPHKMAAGNCASCHQKPFEQVQDNSCTQCHNMTSHTKEMGKISAQHPDLDFRCAQCHMEHNGTPGIVTADSKLCIQCHSSIQSVVTTAKAENVPSLANHPEFRVKIRTEAGTVVKVPVSDKSKAVDPTKIKLNHAKHLEPGLNGKDGPVTLQCASCHEVAGDFKNIKPISFDRHCRDCHSLGFDERLPKVQAPHGDDEAVYPTLFTEYTKLILLSSPSNAGKTIEEPARVRPGETPPQNIPAMKYPAFEPATVAQTARDAERQLFTKTACFLCHDSSMKPKELQTETNSHYTVVKPHVPSRWYAASTFSHGSHEEISCASCHASATKSTKTTDVLLPGIKDCQACHIHSPKDGFVPSECILCHSFHDPLPIPADRKKSIESYLSHLTRDANS